MQLNQPVSPPAPGSGEELKFIRAEVVKVVFESTIKVAVGDAEVKAPHWEKGQAVEEDTWKLGHPKQAEIKGLFSKRPAAYTKSY